MWYRDAALVAVRQQDLERELAAAAAVRALREAAAAAAGRPAPALRVRSAAGIRRLGEAAIGLSRRIDVPDCDGAATRVRHTSALP